MIEGDDEDLWLNIFAEVRDLAPKRRRNTIDMADEVFDRMKRKTKTGVEISTKLGHPRISHLERAMPSADQLPDQVKQEQQDEATDESITAKPRSAKQWEGGPAVNSIVSGPPWIGEPTISAWCFGTERMSDVAPG